MSTRVPPSGLHVRWDGGFPFVESDNIFFRSTKESDREAYERIFLDPVVMARYGIGKSEDVVARFNTWLEYPDIHFLSKLAVVDRKTKKVFGYVILDHAEAGRCSIAVALDPQYWNADYKKPEKNIGVRNRQGLGTEIVQSAVAYVKALSKVTYTSPSDPSKSVNFASNELVATCRRDNFAAYKIFSRVFLQENQGMLWHLSVLRDLFVINFEGD